jgi:NDP-sugar pyrophosphorylase family protein
MFDPASLLDLSKTQHGTLFEPGEPVWTALGRIGSYLERALVPSLEGAEVHPTAVIGPLVRLGQGTVVEAHAVIKGPAWIGNNCQIRSGAYLRENVIAGDGVVLGNSSEFKNCLIFDGCEIPHFNYVGDSILGYKAHLGAGVILSNFRLDRQNITINTGAETISTGLRKMGAVVGDHAELGCNSCINPGSIIGRRCVLYPLSDFRGVLEENHIWKPVREQRITRRR